MTQFRIPARAAALAALLALPALAQSPQALPQDRLEGAATITEAELREWLGTLASPEFGGRGTGQEGFRRAAEYVRAHFEKLGLDPGCADGSYLQAVPWTRTAVVDANSALTLTRDGRELWRLGAADGLHGRASADADATGVLVVAVAGTADGEDLTRLDLTGAAVVVVAKNGLVTDTQNRRGAAFENLRNATRIRNNVGAAGGRLVAIADDGAYAAFGPFQEQVGPASQRGGRASAGRSRAADLVVIRRSDLTAMLEAAGIDGDPTAVDAPGRLTGADVQATLRLDVETGPAPAFNVVAILRGSDPALRDEFVGIGCHLDHLGTAGNGTVFPGADDDGSGSAGLMAIAEAFAENPTKPRRSVLFMAFCGEETGLVGSSFFARNPTVALEKLVAELQVDMIGRDEETGDESAQDNLNSLHLVGSQKLSKDLHDVCVRLNGERAHFDLEWDQEDVFYRSDHWNFAKEGVPIAFFFTGFHPDYHAPTDTPDKIDYAKLQRIATYVYDIAFELAQADQRPLVDADRWSSLQNKGREEPVAPVRK